MFYKGPRLIDSNCKVEAQRRANGLNPEKDKGIEGVLR